MLEDMVKIRIIGTKSIMPRIIEKLHQLKVLHIIEKDDELSKCSSTEAAEDLSKTLVKIRAIAAKFKIKLNKEKSEIDAVPKTCMSEIDQVAESINTQTDKLKEAMESNKKYEENVRKKEILKALGLSIGSLQDYDSLNSYIGYVKNVEDLKSKIKTSKFSLKSAVIDKNEVMALFIDKKYDVKPLLMSHDFNKVDFDMDEVKKIETRESEAILDKLKKECELKLADYEHIISKELDKAEAPLQFQETEQTFVIWGFVPKKSVEKTVKELTKSTKSKIMVEIHKIEKDDIVPVELENPKNVSSFQFFLDLYTLPKYKEIDPTWFMFITFPLLFGFMLGDYGYGIATLIIFSIFKKMLPKFSNFFNILIFASIGTIIFGLIFAEFFGHEFWHPLINRNPHHSINGLMIAAIFAGIVHVNAGLVTGFVNELRAHGFKTAFFEKFSWIFLEIGVVLVVLSVMRKIPFNWILGTVVIAGAIYMLFKAEGVQGIVEIPSIFGNILSYLRLMAIGLASVGLALVINDFAIGFFTAGGLGFLWGVLLLVVGHVINIGIGLLGGFLHSLRLHYVELFSKFYKGGGIKFKPFGLKT